MPAPKTDVLKQTQLILSHVPRTGGASLNLFVRRLLPSSKVYRYRSRHLDQTSNVLAQMSEQERNKYRAFQGHFRFGEHRSLSKPSLYLSLLRHPVERLISLYEHSREHGLPAIKEKLNELSIEDFIKDKIETSKDGLYTAQMYWMTGERTLPGACDVIKERYLMCAATDQLDRMQRVLGKLYGHEELEPLHLNPTTGSTIDAEQRKALIERYEERFEAEVAFLEFVRRRFNRVYAEINVDDVAALVAALPAPEKRAKAKAVGEIAAAPKVKAGEAKPKPSKAGGDKADGPKAAALKSAAPKADAPKVAAQKADAPKVAAQKADAPKAAAPKAGGAKAGGPKAAATKAVAPKTAAPTADASKAAAPKAAAPKADAPKAAAPKADAPKAAAPKADAPKAAAPKADAPKVAAPKTDAPKAAAPKAAAPKVAAPKTDASKAAAPKAGGAKVGGAKVGGAKAGGPKAAGLKASSPKAGSPKVGAAKAAAEAPVAEAASGVGPKAGGPKAGGPKAGGPKAGGPNAGGPKKGSGAGGKKGAGSPGKVRAG